MARQLDQQLRCAEDALVEALLEDPNNRGEAKAWLTSTIAHLQGMSSMLCFDPCSMPRSSSSRYSDRSSGYNPSSSGNPTAAPSPIAACRTAALQLLQLLADAQPAAVSQLLCHDSNFLCSYLTASTASIASWFGHFSPAGIQHFKYGARALANYALTHRSEVWQHLVWAGKHDQAPVAVAAKPHYFAELDIQRTVNNLVRCCGGFWDSDELLRSCESGQWLKLDPPLLAEELYRLLHEPRSSRCQPLQQLLTSFLQEADWTLLCNRLLPLLPDEQLLQFVRLLGQQQQQPVGSRAGGDAGSSRREQQKQVGSTLQQWLQQQTTYNSRNAVAVPTVLDSSAAATPAAKLPCVSELSPLVFGGSAVQSWGLEQLLLANALTCHRAQLLALLRQEEELSQQLLQLVSAAQSIWHLTAAADDATGAVSTDVAVGPVSSSDKVQQQQQQHVQGSAAAGTAAAAAGALRMQQLLRGLTVGQQPQQQWMQLLLLGWLLRLHLLLAGAAGFEAAEQALLESGVCCHQLQERTQQQQQQQQQQPRLDQPKLAPEQQELKQGMAAAEAEQPEQQHKQHQQESQEFREPLQPDEPRQRLRRSSAAAVPSSSGSSSSDDSWKQPSRQRQQKKHKRREGRRHHKLSKQKVKLKKQSSKKHRQRHTSRSKQRQQQQQEEVTLPPGSKRKRRNSQGSNSGDDDTGSSSSSLDSEADKVRRKKHQKGKKRQRRVHKRRNSSSSSEWGEASDVDFDAGGALLVPADFPAFAHDGAAAAAAAYDDEQAQLASVLDALASLSVGGKLWQSPCWLLWLPVPAAGVKAGAGRVVTPAAAAGAAGSMRQCIAVTGTTGEVMDAAAWYHVWLFGAKF